MKKVNRLIVPLLLFVIVSSSCSHKYYTSANFDQQTQKHRLVAIVPAEMIFTGAQPKKLTAEEVASIEEAESLAFSDALYNGILRYANTRKHISTVDFQDIGSTKRLLQEKNISIREAWRRTDVELMQILRVDAIVRMRIKKQRYMSDLASYGVDLARQIGYEYTGGRFPGTKIFMPAVSSKTNDIYATCSLLSEGKTLWNDNYKEASDWNSPANVIIEGITDNFGRHFPYKQKR